MTGSRSRRLYRVPHGIGDGTNRTQIAAADGRLERPGRQPTENLWADLCDSPVTDRDDPSPGVVPVPLEAWIEPVAVREMLDVENGEVQ